MEILRLKEVLKEKGVTGKELAEKVEVTENAISLIVNGKRQPRFELLTAIASFLEVDIKDLFNSTIKVETKTIYIKKGVNFESIGEIKI